MRLAFYFTMVCHQCARQFDARSRMLITWLECSYMYHSHISSGITSQCPHKITRSCNSSCQEQPSCIITGTYIQDTSMAPIATSTYDKRCFILFVIYLTLIPQVPWHCPQVPLLVQDGVAKFNQVGRLMHLDGSSFPAVYSATTVPLAAQAEIPFPIFWTACELHLAATWVSTVNFGIILAGWSDCRVWEITRWWKLFSQSCSAIWEHKGIFSMMVFIAAEGLDIDAARVPPQHIYRYCWHAHQSSKEIDGWGSASATT